MKLPEVCRTCDASARGARKLLNLDTPSKEFPEKSLANILCELTNIDLNVPSGQNLPQCLCTSCSKRLLSAFEYVKQALAANDLLMKQLKSDCLQETPMELCPDLHLELKMETEEEEDITCTELPELAVKSSIDPLIKLGTIKQEPEASEEDPDYESQDSETDDEDSVDYQPVTKEQKRKFQCAECPKSFKRAAHLKQHLKVHADPKPPASVSEHKKAKAIDLNLCKPHGYKLIECLICQNQFSKIADLRRHLEKHPEIVIQTGQKPEELAKLLYPNAKDVSEEQLKQLIRKDLSNGLYKNFYSITNQHGYEMELDSSETECESETKEKPQIKYICELCQQGYARKYQLYEHQSQAHTWLDAPHVCGRCDARFVSLQLLRHHNESLCRNVQKRFHCLKCPLRFRWKQNLRAHVREHRKNIQLHECHHCKSSFRNKKSLTIHLLGVHAEDSTVLPCQWCNRKFFRQDYLVKHLKRHGLREQDIPLAETIIAATSKPNGVKRISCKICNLQFERIYDLRAHIQQELMISKSSLSSSLHQNYDSLQNYSITNESGFELSLGDSETEDEMPGSCSYICELCSLQCRRKYELIQHQRTVHCFDKMPYECEKCVFKCVSKSIMNHHLLAQCGNFEKKLTCNHCSYKFMWPENLEQHIQLQHGISTVEQQPTSEKLEATKEASAVLQCPHCDRTYQMKSRLNNHIRDVHVNGDRKRKDAVKLFLCSLCGYKTNTSYQLLTHTRRHTGEKPFKCDLCEAAFPRHSEMISHRRMHTGEKPFHCTVCGKDFARAEKLKRHMLTHSGLKPHSCNYCEKSYRQAKDLKLHLQQHTGECPFICGTCGERFIQSSTLEKHRMMRRHFDEVEIAQN